VKNINSFRFLEQAIAWEMQRQTLQLMDGQTPTQETRGWDATNNTTFPQRSKEEAEDYRYFPDPDIPPIHLTQTQLDEIKESLPELPDTMVRRWETDFKVEQRFGSLLIEERDQALFFDSLFVTALERGLDVNKLANVIANRKIAVNVGDATDSILAAFTELTQVEGISETDIQPILDEVKTMFPSEVEAYKSGKTQLINFFVGQVLKRLGRKVDMAQLRELIQNQL